MWGARLLPNHNLRQVIAADTVYLLPFKGNRLVEGWQITGIEP
jgi:hypothetical protein